MGQKPNSFIPDEQTPNSFVPDSFVPDDNGGNHPLGFLDSFSEGAKKFLENHPFIKKVWEKANTPLVEPTPVMKQAMGEYTKEHPVIGAIGNTLTGAMTSTSTPLSLGLMGVGAAAPVAKAAGLTGVANTIDKGSRIAGGGFAALGAKNAYEGYQKGDLGEVLGGTLQLGLGGLGALHSSATPPIVDKTPYGPVNLPYNKPAPIGLPEAVGPELSGRRFIGGPSGAGGQVIPEEFATPDVAARYGGLTGLNESTTSIGEGFDPTVLAEMRRQQGLTYGPEAHYPGSRLSLPDNSDAIPPVSGDIRGGFSPQSSADLDYPLNVVPNQVRPRTTQSDILSMGGDLHATKPTIEGENVGFVNGEIPPEVDTTNTLSGKGPRNDYEQPTATPQDRFEKVSTRQRLFKEREPIEQPNLEEHQGYYPNEFNYDTGQFAPEPNNAFGPNSALEDRIYRSKFASEVNRNKEAQGLPPDIPNGWKFEGEPNLEPIPNATADDMAAKPEPIPNAYPEDVKLGDMEWMKKNADYLTDKNGFSATVSDTNEVANPPQVTKNGAIPQPGEAVPKGKDIGAFGAEYNSPHKMLLNHPETVGVVEPILKANDNGSRFIRSTLDNIAEYTQGLDKPSRITLTHLLNGDEVPNTSPDLIQRAQSIREYLDGIHEMFPEGSKFGGEDVGYLENYITHMAKQPEGIRAKVAEIFSHQFGKDSGIYKLFEQGDLGEGGTDTTGAIYEKGTGHPSSPYIETRTGGLKPEDMEWDINKIIPAYVESAAKVIFDKPAIEQAVRALKSVPDKSKLKELAQWYIQNYSGYDANQQLHAAWNKTAGQLADITARSYVNFNPGLHMLHIGEIPVNIFPELGTKYTAQGIAAVLKKPFSTFKEMAQMGMLQGELKPWTFKTPMEKFNSLGYGFSYVESIVKGIAYNGAKAKFLEQGMPLEQAEIAAMRQAKDLTLTVDRARKSKGYSPEASFMGGEGGSRLGGQFKSIPTKIVEQYKDIALQLKNNPRAADSWLKVMRAMVGSGAAIGATGLGAHMFHVNPRSLLQMSAAGAWGNAMYTVGSDLARGDWRKAVIDSALWATPGGGQLKQILPESVTNPGKGDMFGKNRKPAKLRFQ